MNLIQEAKTIARSNQHGCNADIDLLVKIMSNLSDEPVVVMLGSGEVFALAVYGMRPKSDFTTVDINQQNLTWDIVALKHIGFTSYKRTQILADSAFASNIYTGKPIDLLIVDADHSEEKVLSDLTAWEKHMKPENYIFLHDYDANTATIFYYGVKAACDKYFNREPLLIDGWSAVYKNKKGEICQRS